MSNDDADAWLGPESVRGRLLVATPAMLDPNFERTIIFMLEHAEEGALGVVLNRPSELPVSGTIDDWAPVAAEPPVLFMGGPVSPSSVIALATADVDEASEHWSPVMSGLGTVDLEMSPAEIGGIEEVRLFAGFSSWAPGQLEAELVDQAWFVVEAELADMHTPDPDELWWTVVGRQPGALGRLKLFPRDASHN